jgi:D-alanyl-lipoteichoic acid acyltransferase DltB (MBOAT superfamily)
MLFNSYAFIFGFLPLTLAGFFLLARWSATWAAAWLAVASLVFYGYWNAAYVPLLIVSIVCNFFVGARLAGAVTHRKLLLTAGVAANLLLLAYYKYADFFVANLNTLGTSYTLPGVILPLGISFFTFTQIAFLVDVYQRKATEFRFVHYGLFVTYFPHLIAGPVLHHKEMMPQFAEAKTYRFDWENFAVGFTIFFIGLAKKVLIADSVAEYARPVFDAPGKGVALSAVDAWGGALAYTFQLYFDFSGYSDMAIGLSRMVGVKLPLNFASPYKATSIIDFWRCWHMTLSRFLRDYLYVPLGGNRKGVARRYVNLMLTMVLGGLWHGANWTFVVWGTLHGSYLLINHAWRSLKQRLGFKREGGAIARCFAVTLTFLAVVLAWVYFRADSVANANTIVSAMMGGNGVTLPYRWLEKMGAAGTWLAAQGVVFQNTTVFGGGTQMNWLIICALIVWLAPNTQQLTRGYQPALGVIDSGSRDFGGLRWQPTARWLAAIAALAVFGILSLTALSEFIYFQF